VRTRYSQKIDRLQQRVLDGPGVLEPSRRRAAFEGHPLGVDLADRYVGSIHRDAYRITERDVEELRQAGWSEDQIFELSISAAFGAARDRLDAALRAVEGAGALPPVPADEGA
jgi:hypothetical protein